ncbi:MAG TPA: transglutaminase family protein [Steroidobacteraceae bacterium]|jgi:transglutaminase-like putative cysteine protease|nr:transglutaminase family protein [Steroidobacteraceae bacterium]
MTLYAVRHATVYEYGGDVSHSHHLVHLKPREYEFQRCLGHSLLLDPPPSSTREDVDAFGNAIARLEYDRSHDRLAVVAEMDVEIFPRSAASLETADPWEAVRNRLSYHAVAVPIADLEACRFRMRSSHVLLKQTFQDYAQDCFTQGRSIAGASNELMRKIYREFKYVSGSTTNRTSIVDVLKSRRGVCQDFAHFMIACVRSSGLAARYVSGYIRTVRKDGEAAIGGDASHAWVSVYCPPLGWLDFDPTNNCMVGEDHITLAWGRDFGDVSPLRGVIVGGGRHKLSVDVHVQPLTKNRAALSTTKHD